MTISAPHSSNAWPPLRPTSLTTEPGPPSSRCWKTPACRLASGTTPARRLGPSECSYARNNGSVGNGSRGVGTPTHGFPPFFRGGCRRVPPPKGEATRACAREKKSAHTTNPSPAEIHRKRISRAPTCVPLLGAGTRRHPRWSLTTPERKTARDDAEKNALWRHVVEKLLRRADTPGLHQQDTEGHEKPCPTLQLSRLQPTATSRNGGAAKCGDLWLSREPAGRDDRKARPTSSTQT